MSRFRRRRDHIAPAAPDAQERDILEALEDMRTTTAREVMTPRVDVVALKAPVHLDDVALAVKQSGHSRFPVYEDDLDHLLGVLFVKDLFRMGIDPPPTADDIGRRLRKPHLVPETRLVREVLQEMRQRRVAFGVVVDEYGGVEGVLTVKDLVSELVGELPDEFDRAGEEDIVRVDPTRWLVDGSCPVDRLREETGAAVPDGDYVTVAGFLLERFGHIPDEGEELESQGWQYRVAEMERRRIARVVVRAPSGSMSTPTAGL